MKLADVADPGFCLIAGNWKMNGRLASGRTYIKDMARALEEQPPACHVLVCPPFPLLAPLDEARHQAAPKSGLILGAQDCHPDEDGAQTGGVSAAMLADAGADCVIIGHSERRAEGESGEIIAAKLAAVWRAGLVPILCVGEDAAAAQAGKGKDIVADQLTQSLTEVKPGRPLIIAYEPVWAIGTGKTASPEEIAAMHRHIASRVQAPVLYGGSVNPANAGEILALPEVAGALVGGASLKTDSFLAIIRKAPARKPV